MPRLPRLVVDRLVERGTYEELVDVDPGRQAAPACATGSPAAARWVLVAVLLATSATCPVQMFRVGRRVYATQFHPELDLTRLTVRIRVYRTHGYFPPDEADAVRLWDHVVGLASFPGFAELKRSLRELPQLPALGVTTDEVGVQQDWHGGSRRQKK